MKIIQVNQSGHSMEDYTYDGGKIMSLTTDMRKIYARS